ncbi:ABC transporter permease [Mangrovibacterium marinum]|uniref:Putative ABC transport system permease protein n=1 Tax=Mangrovibacterium marinum TaxID=1639118 RepID=A0A2T5BYJ3_9BACT|nr:ABC transporter permease [Mangrovibacterium marinum]PTN07260.1 putative ABC transport system permease protein [Mangrovibacterium marinum]
MNTPDISIGGIIAGLLLLAPVMLVVWQLKLGFNKKLLLAVGRMLLQLGFVAVYLIYIFKLDNPLVNIAYVFMMVFFAALSGIKNSAMRLRRFLWSTFVAMLLPTLFTLIYFNLFVTRLSNIFQANIFIPIAGMMLGNILKSNIVALKSFFNQVKTQEKVYQYLLAAGASRREALQPFFKEAVRTAMAPNMATMATVGLVSLPGVMTGQILGGSDPSLAVKYQIMVMLIIFFTGLASILLQLLFAIRRCFDQHDQFDHSLFEH